MKKCNKDIIKSILNSKTRFLSLFLITLLGVSTFISLNILGFDMNETINNLYKASNVYDIKVSSSINFKINNNIFSSIDSVDYVEYVYNEELFLKNSKKIFSLYNLTNKLGKINLIEGKYPKNENEIIIEYKFKSKYSIGDYVYLDNNKKFLITGYFENVLNRLVDVSENSFNSYSEVDIIAYTISKYFNDLNPKYIYIKLKDSNKFKFYSQDYKEYVNKSKDIIDKYLKIYISNEFRDYKNEKRILLNDSKKIIENSRNELENKEKILFETKINLENRKKELKEKYIDLISAKSKIDKAEEEINKNSILLELSNLELEEAENKIESSKYQIELNESQIQSAKIEINNGLSELESKQIELISQKKELNKNLDYLNSLKPNLFLTSKKITENKLKIEEALNSINKGLEKINQEINNLNIKLYEINISENKILESKNLLNNQISNIELNKEKLFKNYFILNNNIKNIENNRTEFNANYSKNISKINSGLDNIYSANKTVDINLKKLESQKKDILKELNEKENNINENIEYINMLKPMYIIQTIFDNSSYISFSDSIESLNIISKVFPVIFFLIVLLVITTTMSRMIDEERNIIGTYLFLGYSSNTILKKYLVFSLIPVFLGLTMGIFIGINYMTKFIYVGFKAGSITSFNKLYIGINIFHILIVVVIIIFSTILSVYLTLKSELNTQVSNLLKSKIPKNGKSILLEEFSLLWNNLSFKNKITLRNIFRYKSRVLMNLFGIIGCNSLIFLGFAIKNSFSEISKIQFENIRNFDSEINFKENISQERINAIKNELTKKYKIFDAEIKILKYNDKDTIIAYIFENKNISSFINLYDLNNNKIELNDDGAIITERFVTKYDYNLGNSIQFKDLYKNDFNLKLNNIVQNYFSNYVYMTKNYYENTTKNTFRPRSLLLRGNDINYEKILENSEIQNIIINSKYKSTFDKTNESLNYIILFIILLAALISIIVTYTLLEINMSERRKELATIKVLGFHEKEVSMYIYREIILITIVGILLGFLLGNLFHQFIIKSMEKTNVVFVNQTGINPYIYSFILTFVFSILSMFLIHRRLKNINMVESLKMD